MLGEADKTLLARADEAAETCDDEEMLECLTLGVKGFARVPFEIADGKDGEADWVFCIRGELGADEAVTDDLRLKAPATGLGESLG